MDAGEGRDPVRLHRRPRAVRRARSQRGSGPGPGVRRRGGPPRRLPGRARAGGSDGAAVRGVPHHHGGADLLQHDPARPGRHRHPAGAGDARGWRRHLGRRQHVQGQRHRALLPLRAARQPEPAGLQAVARPGLRRRPRWAGRDERVPRRPQPAVPGPEGEGVLDRRQHLGGDPRGQGARGPFDRDRDRRADHGGGGVAAGARHRAGGRHRRVRRGLASGDQRARVRRPGRARRRGQHRRRAPRARDERPDREPDHRGQEPGHLRGAGARPVAHRLRAPGDGDPQRGDDRELPEHGPPARPAAVRGPVVRPAEPDAPRGAAALGRRRPSPARSPCACGGATTTRSSTPPGRTSPTPPSGCRWSGSRTPPSARSTASAS